MRVHTSSTVVVAPARDEYVDLTDQLVRAVGEAGIGHGIAVVYCMHTTCALLVNEWEEGALKDLTSRLSALVPHGQSYEHDDFTRRRGIPDDERVNGRSHNAAMILGGNSQTFVVSDGVAQLGRWQRLIMAELDEPKERQVVFLILGAD